MKFKESAVDAAGGLQLPPPQNSLVITTPLEYLDYATAIYHSHCFFILSSFIFFVIFYLAFH